MLVLDISHSGLMLWIRVLKVVLVTASDDSGKGQESTEKRGKLHLDWLMLVDVWNRGEAEAEELDNVCGSGSSGLQVRRCCQTFKILENL